MKLKYLFLTLLISVIGLHAANNKMLFGIWEITEFKMVQRGVETVSDEKTLRDAGAVWDMHFNADGTFKQDFNMRGNEMKMETESGKWHTVNDSLYIDLQIDSLTTTMKYSYIILGDVVVFTMQHPRNNDKVVTRFRRK
jgi:hypothetical protein